MESLPKLTEPSAYRIRIAGPVRNGWEDFLTDLQTDISKDGGVAVTELIGTVRDQAALFGLLCRVRDLGASLVSVQYLPTSKGE